MRGYTRLAGSQLVADIHGKEVLELGDLCTHCGTDTAQGSGMFVNRIPSFADSEQASQWLDEWRMYRYVDGYMCRKCYEDD